MIPARAELLAQLLVELAADPGLPPEWRREIVAVQDIVFAVQTEPGPDTHSRKTLARKLRSVS